MATNRRRRVAPKILGALVLLLVAGAVAAYWYARPLLLTGTGYAAHNACALQNIAERSTAGDDLPPNPLVPYLQWEVLSDGSVEASLLGILAKQTAWYTPGFGCTVADNRPELPQSAPIETANPIAEAPTPASASPQVQQVLDDAFVADLGTRAVVVVKDGQLVAEQYADGFDSETPQLGWSMAKSATNLLVGRLVATEGIDIHEPLREQLWLEDDRSQITVDHLLRMTSGLKWDETYELGTPITEMLYLQTDMGQFAASQELAHPVGTQEQYSSGSTNIVCRQLLQEVEGDANLPRELLLAPLGLSSAVWETDEAGTPVCSSYLWATPRDWAALGQFALDDGVASGEPLLLEGWITESIQPNDVQEMEEGNFAASWWVNERADGSLEHPDLPRDAYWMAGHDGQRVFIIPSEDMVIVRMGFSPGLDGSNWADLAAELVTALS